MFVDFFKNFVYKNLFDGFSFIFHSLLKKIIKFQLGRKSYNYLVKKYNYTWRNERSIEIPIMINVIKGKKSSKILEIGNVLSHYKHIKHDIVDKYEIGKNVINEDIMKYSPQKKYDLIIAISTFEHIGHDERPKEDDKMLKVLPNLKKILNKNGRIIFTHPIGYNKTLDALIYKNKIKVDKKRFMKRASKLNLWEEVAFDEIKNCKYNTPYNNANAVMIGEIRKE